MKRVVGKKHPLEDKRRYGVLSDGTFSPASWEEMKLKRHVEEEVLRRNVDDEEATSIQADWMSPQVEDADVLEESLPQHRPPSSSVAEYYRTNIRHPIRMWLWSWRRAFLRVNHEFIWLYLIALGVLSAGVGAAMDYTIRGLHMGHRRIFDHVPGGMWVSWPLWVAFTIVVSLLARLFVVLDPNAMGSGIPEMKSVLSGTPLFRFLSLRTFVAKVFGLTAAVGSGLFLGKEGPFVHISAILANNLAKVPVFARIYTNASLLQEMLAVGCAVGVASNFGAPIGGVLFSIEVTSTYYPVRNYWHAFSCAIVAAIVSRVFRLRPYFTMTDFSHVSYGTAELPFFIALAIIIGLAAAAFVAITTRVSEKRMAMTNETLTSHTTPPFIRWIASPAVYVCFVAALVGVVTYPLFFGDFMSMTGSQIMADMFYQGQLNNQTALIGSPMEHLASPTSWTDPEYSIYGTLGIVLLTRYACTILCISTPLATGLYVPILVLGALMGRLCGEVLHGVWPHGFSGDYYTLEDHHITTISPGGYAIVGAAAFAGGVTHTLSSSVIVLELTGQLTYGLPVVLGVVLAIWVSKWFTPSIYERILQVRMLPYLPELPQALYGMKARDIMHTKREKMRAIPQTTTRAALLRVLARSQDQQFPVVQSQDSMALVGTVSRYKIRRLLLATSENPHALGDDMLRDDWELSETSIDGAFMEHEHGVWEHEEDPCAPPAHTPSSSANTPMMARHTAAPQRVLGPTDDAEDPQGTSATTDGLHHHHRARSPPVSVQSISVPAHFQLLESTPLPVVHVLFITMRLAKAYVTSTDGTLVGVVERDRLKRSIGKRQTPFGRLLRGELFIGSDTKSGRTSGM